MLLKNVLLPPRLGPVMIQKHFPCEKKTKVDLRFFLSYKTTKGASINDVDPFLGFFDPPGTPNRPKSTFMDPPYHTEVDFRFGRGEGGQKSLCTICTSFFSSFYVD